MRECQGKQQKRNSLYSKCGYPISIYRKSWTCSRPVEQDSDIQQFLPKFPTDCNLQLNLQLQFAIEFAIWKHKRGDHMMWLKYKANLLKVVKAMFPIACTIANANNYWKTVPEKCIRWYNFTLIKQCCASYSKIIWVFYILFCEFKKMTKYEKVSLGRKRSSLNKNLLLMTLKLGLFLFAENYNQKFRRKLMVLRIFGRKHKFWNSWLSHTFQIQEFHSRQDSSWWRHWWRHKTNIIY